MTERREWSVGGAPVAHWIALLFVVLIGLYMYADRHVITLQVDPIKASLGISDFQVGLLQGLGVAIFAALFGYPIAGLVDRYDKRLILAACTLVWAVGVAGSGMSTSFGGLFLASAIVGAGEAGLLPLTYATIPELFEGRSRLLANSAMVLIGRIGSGVIIAGTGLLLHYANDAHLWLPASLKDIAPWRLTFLAIAVPSPIFIFGALLLPLRRRAGSIGLAGGAVPTPTALPVAVLPFFRQHAALFVPFYASVALLIFGMSALGAFLPAVAMRDLGATGPVAGGLMGIATLVSTLIGLGLAVATSGLLQRRVGALSPMVLLLSAPLGAAVTTPFFLLCSTPFQLFALLGFGFVFLSVGTIAFPTALQEITPRPIRARLISITIILNIGFSALAPIVVGALSTALTGVAHGLLISTVLVAGVAMLTSAALLLVAGRHYLATVDAARAAETGAV